MEDSSTKSKAVFPYTDEQLAKDITSWASWAINNNQNIALYRKPGQHPMMLLDDKSLTRINSNIEDLNKGFLFANYKGDLWNLEATHLVEFIDLEHPNLPIGANELNSTWPYYTRNSVQETTSKESYTQAVQTAISAINEGKLNKVVPTKIKLHHFSDNFNLADAFVKLCSQYTTAFVSVVSTKEFGTWLTATPELLTNVDANGIFETMALAGTQKHQEATSLHQVAWVDKDIEEQAMVSRYIINRFKEIRLRDFIEKGPMTVRAGNLNHLCTTFSVDTKATEFQNLGGVMLNLLHPTSAVCGMPKKAAIKLIEEIEEHDRKFYTGYLGPVNINNETSLFVNLRCMELFEGNSNLFAGAGVTAISDPEKEWEETELKFNTLLNIIG